MKQITRRKPEQGVQIRQYRFRFTAGASGGIYRHYLEDTQPGLPFHFADYRELLGWTARAVRPYKRGVIPKGPTPILTRLGIEAANWIETVRHFRRHLYDCVGPVEALEQCSRAMDLGCLRGVRACRRLLGNCLIVDRRSRSTRQTGRNLKQN